MDTQSDGSNLQNSNEANSSANNIRSKSNTFVTLAYAQTIDGSIAPMGKTRLDISSNESFQLLHSLRAYHDGVLIGINTMLHDEPRLNVRNPLAGVPIPSNQPRPIILDSNLKLLTAKNIYLQQPIIFTCLNSTHPKWSTAKEMIESIGGCLMTCNTASNGRCDLSDCFARLSSDFNIRSVLLEGGADVIQSALSLGLVQQVVVTIRPCFLGGFRILSKQALDRIITLRNVTTANIDDDQVVIYGQISDP